jgi:Flp pilus assembly pilin Flp
MKYLLKFYKDDSGAVTVDWVVLTAAIVGIAIAVINVISGGVENAAIGIDDTLRTAGSGWSFLGTGTETGSETRIATMEELFFEFVADGGDLDSFDNVYGALYSAADNISPDGYSYTGLVDNATGTPVYASEDGGSYSVNGEIYDIGNYDTATKSETLTNVLINESALAVSNS